MRLRRTARNDAAIVRSAWLKTCATGFLCRISTISEERTALCADPRAALRRLCTSVGSFCADHGTRVVRRTLAARAPAQSGRGKRYRHDGARSVRTEHRRAGGPRATRRRTLPRPGEDEAEFLHLDYAQGGTLYVPVAQLHWITRYSGQAPEHAPLHALGSGQWE